MVTFLQELLNFLGKELIVLITAATPVIELRGAIPVGISLGLSPLHATVLSFIGSMIPVPFILFGIRPIFSYLRKTRLFGNLVHRISERSLNKGARVQKYGFWGLILLVAIPLPGTGVWTGSLAAVLLDIRFKWAFPAILIGNLIAALAIVGVSSGLASILFKLG